MNSIHAQSDPSNDVYSATPSAFEAAPAAEHSPQTPERMRKRFVLPDTQTAEPESDRSPGVQDKVETSGSQG